MQNLTYPSPPAPPIELSCSDGNWHVTNLIIIIINSHV